VVHAQLNRAPEQGDGLVAAIVEPTQLERAVADPGHGAAGEGSSGGGDDGSPSVGGVAIRHPTNS
jgi:hypothetical protein